MNILRMVKSIFLAEIVVRNYIIFYPQIFYYYPWPIRDILLRHTHLVQFEENTGGGFVVVVSVLLSARMPIFYVDVANLPGWRRLVVIAFVNVSTKSKNRSGRDIIWNITDSIEIQWQSDFSLIAGARIPFKKVCSESTQCLKFSLSVPLYQIKVLSTFSVGGIGLNPNPAKRITAVRFNNHYYFVATNVQAKMTHLDLFR